MPKPEFVIKENNENRFEVYYVDRNFHGKEILLPYITKSGGKEIVSFKTSEEAYTGITFEVFKNTTVKKIYHVTKE